jgi:dihydroorotate dehydrogenase
MGVQIMVADIETLNRQLGIVETERFIALIQREKFDYTTWRQNLFTGLSGEEISKRAMEFLKKSDHQPVNPMPLSLSRSRR